MNVMEDPKVKSEMETSNLSASDSNSMMKSANDNTETLRNLRNMCKRHSKAIFKRYDKEINSTSIFKAKKVLIKNSYKKKKDNNKDQKKHYLHILYLLKELKNSIDKEAKKASKGTMKKRDLKEVSKKEPKEESKSDMFIEGMSEEFSGNSRHSSRPVVAKKELKASPKNVRFEQPEVSYSDEPSYPEKASNQEENSMKI